MHVRHNQSTELKTVLKINNKKISSYWLKSQDNFNPPPQKRKKENKQNIYGRNSTKQTKLIFFTRSLIFLLRNVIAEPFSKGRTPAERITPPQMKYDWKGQDVLRTGFSIVGFTVTEMH